MKILNVSKIEFIDSVPALEEISEKLDKRNQKNLIDTINWNDFSYLPDVSFSIGYTGLEIIMKFYITENYFKAEKTETNQMVCEDSCVEFFVSPDDDGIYYNFEFNGIGTCLLGSGTCRADSKRVNPDIVSGIRRLSSIGNEPVAEKKGKFTWSLVVAIPPDIFFHHEIKELKGKTFRANFYKCGDKLSVPHYVTWNPVKTSAPDYHQPGYFGILKFI